MDRTHLGLVVAVTFLLVIITMTIRSQTNAIENSANFTQDSISHSTRSAATVLHIMSNSQSQEFGEIERQEFEDLMYNCGGSSAIAALGENIKVARENSLNVCTTANQVERYFSENGLLIGIVTVEESDEQAEWMVVG